MVVGIFFAIALCLLGYFTMIINPDSTFEDRYDLKVSFTEDSGNLKEGAQVRIKGVVVGRVSKVKISDDYKVVIVTTSLTQKPIVYKNYSATVQSSSLLGGEHLKIDIGSPDAGKLEQDAILKGKAPRNLMGDAAEIVHEIRVKLEEDMLMERLAVILKNLEKSSQNMTAMFDHISQGKGTLGKLIYDEGVLKKVEESLAPFKDAGLSIEKAGNRVSAAADELKVFSTKVTALVDDAQKGKGLLGKILSDETAWDNFNDTIANLKTFSQKLNAGDSTLGKFLSDKGQIYKEFKGFVETLSTISTKINSGEGTLSQLINDGSAYKDLKAILQEGKKAIGEVQHAIQDFREQAPIATFGGIIFGTL
jgi:phospholipid/cholesterol/gamma-HCH transport system substrate-binding protein